VELTVTGEWWLRRALVNLVLAGLVATAGPVIGWAQDSSELTALHGQVSRLHGQGRYAEALPLAERYVALARQRYGEHRTEYATAISWLAGLYKTQGRYAEAEPLFERSLANTEKTLGPDHPRVGSSLNSLAALYQAQSRYAEAEPLFKRSIAIRENALGPDHADVGPALNNLALLYRVQGRYAEAEPLYRRSLAIAEQGPDHPDVGTALNNLGALYQTQSRYVEAEPLYKRSLAIREQALRPDHPDIGQSLHNLAALYSAQGRYGESEPLYKRDLAITEQALGPDHPSVGTALLNLAELYRAQGRYAEAEPNFQRSLAIREKALGPDHPAVSASLNGLAALYSAQGRYGKSEPLYRRSLAIAEKALGPDHPDVGTALNNLALLYQAQGRYSEAEPYYTRSLAIHEKALGAEHPLVGVSLLNLAELYRSQGRYAEAEPLYKRSLAIRERALGPDHPDVGISLNNLAALYQDQGRYAEAEPLYKRSLAIREKVLGPDHPDVGSSLNNLAGIYESQGHFAEAEPLYKRTVSIVEKALGPEHPWVGSSLNNLAQLYRNQGRAAEAEPLFKSSLAIREKALGRDHPDVGSSLNNLAGLYQVQGRFAEAEPLFKSSLAIREKALGPDHRDVGQSLNNLAALYRSQGRAAEAEQLNKRAVSTLEKALGPDHPDVGTALSNLALLAFAKRDWAGTADYWSRSTEVIQRRVGRSLTGAAEGSSKGEAQRLSWQFAGLIKMTHRLPTQDRTRLEGQARAMFETAQWPQSSEAAASLAQMSARSAKGSPELSPLVRERQDLIAEWQAKDRVFIAAKSEPPAKRNATAEKVLSNRLTVIDTRLAAINGRLAKEFPDYAALASPAPVPVTEVQAQLGANEALVLFLDTPEWSALPEETFVWVVTKSAVRWVRSELGTVALKREVVALRCGLDVTAWEGDGAANCARSLGIPHNNAPGLNQPLPFDHGRAHQLYKGLFGEVQDLIKGKHLLIVPSGPLTQLPFQVLVTKPPTSGDQREVAWLVREHAVTVLPAVSSLKALRRVGRPSAAPRPIVGFGNPLLDGPSPGYAAAAKAARDRQHCQPAARRQLTSQPDGRAGLMPVSQRSGTVDVSNVRAQVPLPETADELCSVAADLGAGTEDIRLGASATERDVKTMSEWGVLAGYRVVHFATHGAVAGEINAGAEPGLILTPPDTATEEDDGYLSASEIAGLKLDAEWVILSACNTAAGGASGAEALSGLARAFFYAGARALLVSHWSVDSAATVILITRAFSELKANPGIGRAEALRRAMLALIDGNEPLAAHPAYWAPFVVVGEGGGKDMSAPPAKAPDQPL
jgi:tetratricopeptide (TPR) repeat protein/CHAT domain-containing protein